METRTETRQEKRVYTVKDLVGVHDVKGDEQETTVQISRTGDVAHIWTNDNTMITKIRKLMERAPDQWKLVKISWQADGSHAGYFFECPRKAIKFGVKNSISNEVRAAMPEKAQAHQNPSK